MSCSGLICFGFLERRRAAAPGTRRACPELATPRPAAKVTFRHSRKMATICQRRGRVVVAAARGKTVGKTAGIDGDRCAPGISAVGASGCSVTTQAASTVGRPTTSACSSAVRSGRDQPCLFSLNRSAFPTKCTTKRPSGSGGPLRHAIFATAATPAIGADGP